MWRMLGPVLTRAGIWPTSSPAGRIDGARSRSLREKVVVITGASSGFGRGFALRFVEEGAFVVLAARRGELLEELADACQSRGGKAISIRTDVSRRPDVERLVQLALETWGRIDIWVNNAGVAALGPFERVPLEMHEQVVDTVLLGTLYGSYFAYNEFLRCGSGILINVSSGLGRSTSPGYSSYTAAKHGVVGLSESLRQEIEQRQLANIHICNVMPGAYSTPFFEHAANYTGHRLSTPASDPGHVIETVLRLACNPQDRHAGDGYGIEIVLTSHGSAGKKTGHSEDAKVHADSPGAVRAPVSWGTGISVRPG